MPIFEYRCAACSTLTTILIRNVSKNETRPTCESCGSTRVTKVISKVGRLRSAQDVIEEKGTPREGQAYEDPRQIGAWVEKRFEDYGMPIPDDTRNMIDAARDGVFPDEISDI
ncbi:MAG: zinc ribbon domain-containing protein [Chloroflexota bacterium]|nr:zinc ribbon domain-containing protein [Chloroflexota bacterium]